MNDSQNIDILKPGILPYMEAWDLQKKVHSERQKNRIPDTLILLEHLPVYTLGRHAEVSNITADRDFLSTNGIGIIQSDRGGDVTYHGPGQLVGYPVFRMKDGHLAVKKFVRDIEEILIAVLDEYGIQGTVRREYPGVWVGGNKIAAIGMRIMDGVSMHGFALNVDPELRHYEGIIACGIRDGGVTSMSREAGEPLTVGDVAVTVETFFRGRYDE